jgi:hypothetical protein
MESYGLYPLACRFGDAIAVFDFESMTITDVIDALGKKSMLRAESLHPLY